MQQVEVTVHEWLRANDDGNSYELNAFSLEGAELSITVSGLGDAPPITDLVDRLVASYPDDVIVPTLRWSQLESVPIGEVPPTPVEVQTAELRVVADDWADDFDLTVTGLTFDGQFLTVEVQGAEPAPLEPFLEEVENSGIDVVLVDVFFTRRVRLDTTTTTTTPTTTPDEGVTTTEA